MRTSSTEKDLLMWEALRDPEFRAKVVRLMGPRTGGCMEWRGTVDNRGYGRVKIPLRISGQNIPVRATRLVWTLIHERVLRPGTVVAHTCDNKVCVNPEHLYSTSQAENIRDAYDRGRREPLAGTRSPGSKLTDDDVREIRASTETQGALAERYGVVQSVISAVRLGKTWRHVT